MLLVQQLALLTGTADPNRQPAKKAEKEQEGLNPQLSVIDVETDKGWQE